ncbi:hypothetical protein ACTID9_15845 [Brevibacillus fluminis]|uniref:hypothetical protein n=1 Tax=Brevibacillus fluminis TaxID=511487 RepID=UPI003F8A2321
MRQFVSLVGIVALLLIGCSKESDVPPAQSATAAIQQDQAVPAPVEEKKSVEWVAGRLLEISSQYFAMLGKAQDKALTFEEFRNKLHSIMTDSFIDQENLQQFYTAGNGLTELFLFHYEKGAFDARTTILEQTAERIKVKTMWFANELNSGYYEISTLVKSGDRWVLDAKESEPIPERGFELTPEEATVYMKSYPYYDKPVASIKFVGTKTLEGSSVYGQFYEFNCDGTTYYISPVDGYILDANMERF